MNWLEKQNVLNTSCCYFGEYIPVSGFLILWLYIIFAFILEFLKDKHIYYLN